MDQNGPISQLEGEYIEQYFIILASKYHPVSSNVEFSFNYGGKKKTKLLG